MPPRILLPAAIYARVSTIKQETDLNRQIEFLTQEAHASGYHTIRFYKDIASGLRDQRQGLKRLIKDAFARKFSAIFVIQLQSSNPI